MMTDVITIYLHLNKDTKHLPTIMMRAKGFQFTRNELVIAIKRVSPRKNCLMLKIVLNALRVKYCLSEKSGKYTLSGDKLARRLYFGLQAISKGENHLSPSAVSHGINKANQAVRNLSRPCNNLAASAQVASLNTLANNQQPVWIG